MRLRITVRRTLALIAISALASGCFGYNKSAKRWAYAGDTVLILGGAGAITGELLTRSARDPVMPNTREPYSSPWSGRLFAGALLVAAGVVGIAINATRPDVRASR